MGSRAADHLPLRVFLAEHADLLRTQATKRLNPDRRAELGQYLTPSKVAAFMASLFIDFGEHVRLLDAGAGVGALLAATTAEACQRPRPPEHVHAVGFEIDKTLLGSLRRMMRACDIGASQSAVSFTNEVVPRDFIEAAVEMIEAEQPKFTHAILNPPYAKLNTRSATRRRLRRVGIEANNLYTAFVALAIHLLEPGGELIAITPRSFCNGPYFRPFRELLLGATCLRRFHVFESRKAAFAEDDVLQENVIFVLVKGRYQSSVVVSSSRSIDDDLITLREVKFEQAVRPGDPEHFIHLVPSESEQTKADALSGLPCCLADLGLTVSTGKVVDFRARAFLRKDPAPETMPLIYPTHFHEGKVRWPKATKKPNALVDAPDTAQLWMPRGTYVLVKRFSSKEEARRVVAAVFDPEVTRARAEKVGFENHLNVFHAKGAGLDADLAVGLSGFLNSTVFDICFRQFSGHTQVNATDLRSMKYPEARTLRALGKRMGPTLPAQEALDELVEEVIGLRSMAKAMQWPSR
jgi:adenine-specific DNA-methyltransferase